MQGMGKGKKRKKFEKKRRNSDLEPGCSRSAGVVAHKPRSTRWWELSGRGGGDNTKKDSLPCTVQGRRCRSHFVRRDRKWVYAKRGPKFTGERRLGGKQGRSGGSKGHAISGCGCRPRYGSNNKPCNSKTGKKGMKQEKLSWLRAREPVERSCKSMFGTVIWQ